MVDIKDLVVKLIKKHKTNNPFILAKKLNIIIIYADLKSRLGYFNYYKRTKFIFLNNHIPKNLENFVCAHELGHALRHPTINTPFLKEHTLFSTDKIEREASTFAVELLLPDQILQEHSECCIHSIAKSVGIPDKLVSLKRPTSVHQK